MPKYILFVNDAGIYVHLEVLLVDIILLAYVQFLLTMLTEYVFYNQGL